MNDLFLGFEESLIAPAVAWLQNNGCDPNKMVHIAEQELLRRGRSLPKEHRLRYFEKVLLGEFFARWAKKHRGRAPRDLLDDGQSDEMRTFQLAMIAAGDERAFTQLAPRFARRKMVERVGLSLGTADEFTAFVSEHTVLLAGVFLKNFDATTHGAARKSVRYLQMTAVSWYLVRRTRPIRSDAPNLQEYLAQSRRLSPRTALAIKLAYLPALLTAEERATLRDRYSFNGSQGPRMPIKDIAELLGYANPAALSRKLYRVREWCRSAKTGRVQEVV